MSRFDKKFFFDLIRDTISLTDQNVAGFDFLLDEGRNRQVPLPFLAYILATVFHETASTMQPIAEYGKGRGRKYGKKGKYGQIPYGRGYVQLTWDENYERADRELGLAGALLKNFDLAMEPKIASQILFKGMERGWFTGKRLSDYIDLLDEDDKEDLREFSNSRRIINGTDKQVLIGQYALTFEKALRASGYGLEEPQMPAGKPEEIPEDTVPEKKENVWVRLAVKLAKLLLKIFVRKI